MATALGQGLVEAGLAAPESLLASDPVADARARFAEATGAETNADNAEVIRRSDVIFLAVKPYQIAGVAVELGGQVVGEKLLFSIAAGVRLQTLADAFGSEVGLVRVMPNTPCLVGRGACGYCLGAAASDDDDKLVAELLGAVGIAYRVEERLLDAVTGLSGSGPAFVYVMIEALSDGGVRMGLPRDVANALAAQTVGGAAEMVASTGEHPGVLKDRVTSPGGTTIAGIGALESGGLRAALMAAVEAATLRSIELGKGT